MKLTIKEIVKDNTVEFVRYRKGNLYYRVIILLNYEEYPYITYGETYEFPVPIEDCGDADFHSHDKAILFMRYIRKALEEGTFVKV